MPQHHVAEQDDDDDAEQVLPRTQSEAEEKRDEHPTRQDANPIEAKRLPFDDVLQRLSALPEHGGRDPHRAIAVRGRAGGEDDCGEENAPPQRRRWALCLGTASIASTARMPASANPIVKLPCKLAQSIINGTSRQGGEPRSAASTRPPVQGSEWEDEHGGGRAGCRPPR